MGNLDLTGQKFGRLTVIEKTDKRKCGFVVWLCRCDCGNEYEVRSNCLRNGVTRSCGCLYKEVKQQLALDLTGQRFGRLTAIERTANKYKHAVTWRCKCDCGNITDVTVSSLTSGCTKSCGCLLAERLTNQYIDLHGQRFGRLTVLRKTEKRTKGGNVFWECRCDCGNIVERNTINIRKATQCPECAIKEKDQSICNEYIGKKFGKLLILEQSETSTPSKRLFRCRCECGNIYETRLDYLKSGQKVNCGCVQSERRIPDFSGQRFGKLTVLEKTNKRAKGGNFNYIWKCRCDCGNIVGVATSRLKNNSVKCCGCTDPESIVYDMTDVTGQRFGNLTVLGEIEQGITSISQTIWRCQCDCGNIVETTYQAIISGNTKSCGCRHKDIWKRKSRN